MGYLRCPCPNLNFRSLWYLTLGGGENGCKPTTRNRQEFTSSFTSPVAT
jgi:hypothetical protein